MNFELPGIYPITDTLVSGISHAEQVEKLIAGGAEIVQLREKRLSPGDFFKDAEDAIRLARKHGVRVIINDRIDIALALNADGVHLGQDDLPPDAARAILGKDAVIGFSTHTLEQAVKAVKLPIDYIAVGPIFETHTKQDPDAVVGLEKLRQVRNAIGHFPLVAIGGINAENLASVIDAGADSAAMIGAVVSDSLMIEARMAEFCVLYPS